MQATTQTGQYNRRVTIVQPSTATNVMNESINSWTDGATVWASMDFQNSSLIYETTEFLSKAVYRVTLRYSRSLNLQVKDRLRYTDPTTGTVQMHEIQSIFNVGMGNRELLIMTYVLDGDQ